MEGNEILEVLKRCANFTPTKGKNGYFVGVGTISLCPECATMRSCDYELHYNQYKKELEALPWEKVVENPRLPQKDEYPTENGEYVTMLDCNEHEVLVNTFKNGSWLLYHNTHVKWWMPLTRLGISDV